MNTHEGRVSITLLHKNITLTLYSVKELKLLLCERHRWREGDKRRQRQTVILTQGSFFFWSYHAVLSLMFHLALLLIISRGYSIGGRCGPLTQQSHLRTTSWHSQTHTDCRWLGSSHEHQHISFYNALDLRSTTYLLPLIYTGASCSEKSLINGSVKVLYATRFMTPFFYYHEF